MATLNDLGQILARCVDCEGAMSRFEYTAEDSELGVVIEKPPKPSRSPWYKVNTDYQFRLFRCVGCGMGALGVIRMEHEGAEYPGEASEIVHFHPEAKERLPLPKAVPEGIRYEFREAEACLENECYTAAAALFRSVLDKTMRANGYKPATRESPGTNR